MNINPEIAVAISTRNRKTDFINCYNWIQRLSPELKIFVVNDASEDNYTHGMDGYTFIERAGIPAVKNKCLQLCYEYGAKHIFLFDDDTFPLTWNWYLPYIMTGQKHLNFTFWPSHRSSIVMTQMYNGEIHECRLKEHRICNGCMMYFDRECLDVVGGFDTTYGLGKYEHVDLTRRIYNARLTTKKFADVMGSEDLLYCLDASESHKRSFSSAEQEMLLHNGYAYFRQNEHSTKYIEFRT